MIQENQFYTIYIVSDGTGRTAEQALNAALTQFSKVKVNLIKRTKVRTEQRIRKIVFEAKKAGGFIVHTLVSNRLRTIMLHSSRKHNVDAIDLMGGLLSRLSEEFATSPSEKPGLFGQINESYFRRIATMEFAFRHDDGQRVNELRKAEIVLLGVSRTFKTPISIYLAFKEWFVANVPILIGEELPPIIYQLPPSKVFCLDTNARVLAELRHVRQDYLKRALGKYDDIEYVKIELMNARKIFGTQPKWSIINVTSKPIEEIAAEILAIMGSRE